MKKILFFAAAVAALLTSCNKENATQDFEEVSTVYATFAQDNATKVVMGASDGTKTPLNWNQGDEIVVVNANNMTYGKYQTAPSVQDGDSRAEFVLVDGTEINPSVPHFAVYPYERIFQGTYAFEYKAEQAYVENSFDPAQMPLTAKNASGNSFTFNAQAAVVRLKVSTTTSDVKVTSIELASKTKALTGYADADLTAATYGVPVRNTGKTTTLVCPAGGVAINGTAKEFNIVVPGQTYPSGDLTITVKTNKGFFKKTSKAEAIFAAGKVYNISVSGEPALPAGALPGVFTVGNGTDNIAGTSDDVKVYFSKGNLQAKYNGTNYIWGFAANQYDCIGDAAGNTTITAYGTNDNNAIVDLFGWSTSATNYGINVSTESSTYSGDFVDWGKNIGDGKTWRTLTKDEWVYLFNTRSASTVNGVANARYAKAKVNDEYGVILLPDSYTHPAGVDALKNINKADASFDVVNSYDISAWTKLESAGTVFLPAAGGRSGSTVYYSGREGCYRSSTVSAAVRAYDVNFNSSSVNPGYEETHQYGCSVRLITDVN